ncbi:hypothetical protein C8F04DRAFT_487577 [Mycena alexandri]|uniref:C2H2-type domain-containing protein n=1 Tax=Mycena alexandri TaxID=1745969 RepID=A0AAD6WQA0_9AGAR|nr:hypothetical protein C8F04DRAFT_487577 [Mycena alexandri]
MATPLPLSSSDINIDDYFDFDAASCDPRVAAGWEIVETGTASKALSVMDFDESILKRLLLDHDIRDDTHQIKVDFAGAYSESYDDHILEPAANFGWNDLEAYYYSDSESSRSAPGSLASLSPPSSPISAGADDDVDFLSVHNSRNPSPAPFANVPPNELATTTIHSAALFECFFPPPTIVHAPRPSSLRSDTVESLENIVQPPVKTQPPEHFHDCRDVVVYNGSEGSHRIIYDDAPPFRPPSRDTGGPLHRDGKSKRKARRKVTCTYPGCHQTLSRKADLPRHWVLKHEPDTPLKNFRERGATRKWCAGCLSVLSRADARRRHELTCPHMVEYMQYGVRNAIFEPLPEIYAENREEYRLWCSHCYGTFPTPDERYGHEGPCSVHPDTLAREALLNFRPSP